MNNRSIAYFCAEYALNSALPTYAGGMGILAGDYLREADDQKLPLVAGDVLISFATTLFEENCLLSYHPGLKKIMFIGYGWYHFIYEGGHRKLKTDSYHSSWGSRFFNHLLEPLLGLHRTTYQEYKDGKVINYFRYLEELGTIYNNVFVLMPAEQQIS